MSPAAETAPRYALPSLAQGFWWILVLVSFGLILAGIPGLYVDKAAQYAQERSLQELGVSPEAAAGLFLAISLAIVSAHYLLGWFLFRRRAGDPMALFVSYTLVSNGAILPLSNIYAGPSVQPFVIVMVNAVIYVGLVSSIILLFIFPDGRFVPGWTRYLALPWMVFTLLFQTAASRFPEWPGILQTGGILVMLIWAGGGVFAQVYRYRHVSSAVQRQQAKWALAGLIASVVGPFQYVLPFVILPSLVGGDVPNIFYQRVGAAFFTYSFLLEQAGILAFRFATIIFPLSFAIAILRYRLWDIDILINRTLVYGTLTALLGGIYFISIVVLEFAFRSLTGQDSQLAIVLSTLAIAALFVPLRARVQAFIDRRFYRDKYNAQRILARFAAVVRNEVDVNALTGAILQAVNETVHPSEMSLWLRK
ncbi:MAG TPA: hypothetical protein VMN57_09210 [Anaerolineales bacterium]|nr:hypothetical protein [Anaerolineales bacterium]